MREEVIVQHAMRWPDEIRDPSELLPPPVELTEDEIEGALALLESMSRENSDGPEFQERPHRRHGEDHRSEAGGP
ncbi:hypothetical protein ACFYO2_48340 [Streptomyces sp. NPDC006602]|uniref:hypothetical protein n=1 Tax=Streptomyces sp. NPDC006602 TaxID=3364751 RepID=UPI003690197A